MKNLHTQMSPSQSEERMFFTREKKKLKRPIIIAKDLFFSCEKNDTSNQKPQRYVSFGPKFLPFLALAACSALALRVASQIFHEERQLSRVFSVEK